MTTQTQPLSQDLAAARERLDKLDVATQRAETDLQTTAITAAAHSILVLAEQVAAIRVLIVRDAMSRRSDGQPVAQADGQPVPQADGQPVAQADGQPVAQADGQPVAQADGQPVAQADGQPVAQADGQPVPQADGQPVAQADIQPVPQADGQLAAHDKKTRRKRGWW